MAVQVARPVLGLKSLKAPSPKPAAPVAPSPEPKPEPKQQPQPWTIAAAEDGPAIASDLPAHLRGRVEPVRTLTGKQMEILSEIIKAAGDGHPSTLGLRLVLAASRHESAGAWPVGILSRALHVAGRPEEGKAVYKVALGARVSRFSQMAAVALEVLNTKLEAVAK
jgi:hypothetical protein